MTATTGNVYTVTAGLAGWQGLTAEGMIPYVAPQASIASMTAAQDAMNASNKANAEASDFHLSDTSTLPELAPAISMGNSYSRPLIPRLARAQKPGWSTTEP